MPPLYGQEILVRGYLILVREYYKTRLSNIKKGSYKPRVHVTVSLLAAVRPPS